MHIPSPAGRVRRQRRLQVHLVTATDAAQQAGDLSLQLYTAGLRDFREVLDSQRSLLTLQDSLASSVAQVSANMIRLYKSLGGGWSATSCSPPQHRRHAVIVHRGRGPRPGRGRSTTV